MSTMGVTGDVPAPGHEVSRRLRWMRVDRAAEAPWVRPAFAGLIALTALAYLWNLSASGYANSFYAAAAQAATESWKALFFGSLDSSSFITVDKPPASLWLMGLSGRIFGFSSWSMLLPQALEGVAAVGLLYGATKRWFGPAAALAAGATLAMTPVAALMFRFNNPDALLVALLVASAYCLTRAIERAGTRWVLATGALVGFAFLAKMGQAFLVLPAFALAYFVAAPATWRRRATQLLAGGAAVVVAGGWWVAIVALLPASSRPFIDGSPTNNIFNLIFGYNGLSRIFGGGGPGGGGTPGARGAGLHAPLLAGGGGGGANFSGATGITRMFNNLMGGQASWLLPAALVALLACAWLSRGTPRTDRRRAALIIWGGWLLVTAAIFSFSSGVIHTYYAVALAPAIAALVAIGAATLWEHRTATWARLLAAATVGATGAWAYVLLDRAPDWEPWLRPVVLVATVLGAAGVLAGPVLGRLGRRAAILTAACVAVACFAGPLAYSAQTITTAHAGSLPSAGPSVSGAFGGFTGARGFGGPPPGATPGGGPGAGLGGFPGGPPSAGQAPSGTGAATGPLSGAGGGLFGRPGSGGASGAPGEVAVNSTLAKFLEAGSGRYRWIAATSGSGSAASIELATGGKPVMAIGGFNGNGGELTLSQFERYVARGDIHYYVELGSGGGPGGLSSTRSSQIATWVAGHFHAQTVGGATLYRL